MSLNESAMQSHSLHPAPNLENRMTVCMGYPAMTSQKRAGKRRRKGAGNPCRENG